MSTPDPATTPWVPLWPLGVDAVPLSTKAQPSGVASLGADGKVPASQLPASALAAGTAIIGSVSSAGGILMGTGFTVAKTGTGQYVITFSTPFVSPPSVVAQVLRQAAARIVHVSSIGVNSFQVNVYDSTAGAANDESFDFIASQGASYTPTAMSDKTVGGAVSAAGAVLSGTGFTVSKAGSVYTVTFSTPFPSAPIVLGVPGTANIYLAISNVTPSSFVVSTITESGNGAFDGAFSFIASLGFTYAPTTLLGKMVNGSIPAAGTTPTSGTGFTYTHTNGSGIYVFTFSTPFPTPPIITANLLLPQANKVWVYVTAVSTTGFTLGLYDNGAGAVDAPINFEARDPALAVASSTLPATTIGSEWSYNQITAPVTVNTTSEATAVPIIVGSAFTADGLKVKVEFWAPDAIFNAAGAQVCTFVLLRDTTVLGQVVIRPNSASTGQNYNPPKLEFFDTPSAGSHSYTVKCFTDAASGTVGAGPGGSGAKLPAFLRVTKAQ